MKENKRYKGSVVLLTAQFLWLFVLQQSQRVFGSATIAAVHAGSRPWHSTDHPFATVQTRAGPDHNYRRYPAFVPPQSQSQSQSPFTPHAPACDDAQTALNTQTHTGRRGYMLVHADRHLPCAQRPHTRCHSHTRSLTHTCLTHTHHTSHTRGGTLIHTP